MIGHDQSSPATDHSFCPIIGCSASAGLDGDPSDPMVTSSGMMWGHEIIYAFQLVDHEVTPVTPQNTKRLYGKDRAATALPLGRLHVSGSNVGKLGSLGSLGSPLVAADHRFPPIWNGSFPRGGTRGDSEPRKNALCRNSSMAEPKGKHQ